MDALSYLVPEGLTVTRGDLVIVPFRTASVRGVVLSLAVTSPPYKRGAGGGQPLKRIERVEYKAWISDAQLSIFERLAAELLQSVSTILHEVAGVQGRGRPTCLPTTHASIRRSEASHIQAAVAWIKSHDRSFIQATDFVQMTAIAEAVKQVLPGPHRLFVPHHHNADHLNGAQTRLGALAITADRNVDLVLRSGTPEYASYDRNPRYDARQILLQEQTTCGGKVAFLDVIPRVNDFVHIDDHLSLPPELVDVPQVIDLVEERKAGFSTLLSDPLIAAITDALAKQKDVLLSYNRKGVATGLLCRDCGYAPRCKTCGGSPTVYGETLACHHCGTDAPMLAVCPKCGSTKLKERGVGNQQIEKRLRTLFPEVEIQRIEKGKQDKQQKTTSHSTIILATRHYLDAVYDPFHPPAFGLVADLMADLGLSDPSYDATEQTLLRLSELRGVAFRAKCPYVVQAFDAPLIKKMLTDPLTFLEEERQTREQVGFPPYGSIYRLSTRGTMTIEAVKDLLSITLAGLHVREHEEHKKPVLEIYAKPGMEGNLRSALKQLPDDVIIQSL